MTQLTKEDNQLFRTEQYDYLTAAGYNFAKVSTKYISFIVMDHDKINYYQNIANMYKGESINSCYGKNGFIETLLNREDKKIPSVSPSDINLQFTTYFYNKYPQFQSTILKNYYQYFSSNSKLPQDSALLLLTDNLMNNKSVKEIASFIVKFPVSAWTINDIKLPVLVEYLQKKRFTESQIDQTLFSFIKARKNQIKGASEGEYVKNFLLNQYGENSPLLTPYLEFFPILKSHYDVPDIAFVQNPESLAINLIVSAKEMKKSFLIDLWSNEDYGKAITNVVRGIQKYYKIPTAYILDIDKQAQTTGIFLMHDNKHYTKEWFEKTFIDFFSYLRNDSKFIINVENIGKWCQNRDLTEKVNVLMTNEEKNNNLQPVKKNKI